MYRYLLSLFSLLGACLMLFSAPAHALCVSPEAEGEWVSHPTRGIIAELDVGFLCQDQILNGQPYPPGDPHTLHAFGDCLPTSCDWGERAAAYDGTWHTATYDFGWATKTVWAKMSAYYAGELYVWIYTDFRDGRVDYSDSGYMIRRASSCIDDCGSVAPDGCWCDASCIDFGDCCIDKVEVCDL